jgi:hypothetical protein
LVGEAIMSEKKNEKKIKLGNTISNVNKSCDFDYGSEDKINSHNKFNMEFLKKYENNTAKLNNYLSENHANDVTEIKNNEITNNCYNTKNDKITNIITNITSKRKESSKNKYFNCNNLNDKNEKDEKNYTNCDKIISDKKDNSKQPEFISQILKKPTSKRIKMKVSFFESFRYLFCYVIQKRNKNFKKLNIIRYRVDELLDILNLFRTINDFDRFKKLILDNEQLKLFNLPYFLELNFADPVLLSQTTMSYENNKKLKQDEVNSTLVYNLVAAKDDLISKKMLNLVNS